MRTASLLVALLITGTMTASLAVPKAHAASSPVNFNIIANVEGWNSTNPGSFIACSPSGTPTCNPTITEFRGVSFTTTVKWGDCCTHDFAIYTAGFPAGSVNTLNTCSLTNTNGCLAVSASVFQTTASLSFTPTVPKDDFTGLGGYEYYCQFHPGSMHGKFIVYKSPDLDNNGTVNIVDVATVAFSFGATPTSANWNVAADLNNDGVVNILDVAFDAFYFGQPI